MTETPWEAAVYAASIASNQPASNVDYHRENLRQLKKMQAEVRMKKEAEANRPLKAFPLTEANKKKFDHVQSKVQEWVVNQSGRESKPFLRSHSKTGPFLAEDSGLDSDSVIRVKRLSGLKSKDKQGLLLQVPLLKKKTASRALFIKSLRSEALYSLKVFLLKPFVIDFFCNLVVLE